MEDNIRLKNLRLLANECWSQGNLARQLGIEHKEIVRYFKNKYSPISDPFAREIEQALNKPPGWMDRKNYDLALTNEEWRLLEAYRAGNDRDKLFLSSLANLILQT